eukprot:gene8166-7520_t
MSVGGYLATPKAFNLGSPIPQTPDYATETVGPLTVSPTPGRGFARGVGAVGNVPFPTPGRTPVSHFLSPAQEPSSPPLPPCPPSAKLMASPHLRPMIQSPLVSSAARPRTRRCDTENFTKPADLTEDARAEP